MSDTRAETRQNKQSSPSLWKPGDPYKYPIPKPDGNSWEIVLQPYLKKDKIQCATWKEDVHYLLIFAGLFSVVMSIFVLHSVQPLHMSANDVSANALLRIADRMDAMAILNGTAASISQSNNTSAVFFSAPSRSVVRVSVLWFISLVLSLSTLIVGIVLLQWIREHQRYGDNLSQKEVAAIYHMRAEALKKWYVPQIVSGLPLLLLLAVVFFFSGIIVYLFTINLTVAITTTVFIGLAFLFLIFTSFLPTFQSFLLSFSEPSRTKDIPPQCPYKSPQSLTIYFLIAWVFKYSFFWGRRVPLAFYTRGHHKNWAAFDSWWTTLRTAYSQFIHGVFSNASPVDRKSPGFDESRILVDSMRHHSDTSKTVLAAYHCFQEISNTALELDHLNDLHDVNAPLRKRNQFLHKLYWNSDVYGKRTEASNQIDATSDTFKMHEENMMLFLWLSGDRAYPDPIARGVASHLLELQSRKLGYSMVQASLEDACQSDDREELWLSRITKQYRSTDKNNILPWTVALYRRLSKEVIEASVEQYLLVLDSFFRKYATEAGQAWTLEDLRTNVHGRAIIQNFLAVAVSFKEYLFRGSASSHSMRFRSTLTFIAKTLQSSWTRTETHERHDFLFYAVTYFLVHIFPANMITIVDEGGVPLELVQSLASYETSIDKETWSAVFSGHYSIGDWSTALHAYGKTAVSLQEDKAEVVIDVLSSDPVTFPTRPSMVESHSTQTTVVQEGDAFTYPPVEPTVAAQNANEAHTVTEVTEVAEPKVEEVFTDQSGNGNGTIVQANAHTSEQESVDTAGPSHLQVDQNGSNTGNVEWAVQGFQAQSDNGQVAFAAQNGQVQIHQESQGFRAEDSMTFEQRQQWLLSQNEQYNTSRMMTREEWELFQQSQSQMNIRNDSYFNSYSQRFDLSQEERRRLEYEEWRRTQSFSQSSTMYNTTRSERFDSYGSSWGQNHLSWASDAKVEHEQVDGNLFY